MIIFKDLEGSGSDLMRSLSQKLLAETHEIHKNLFRIAGVQGRFKPSTCGKGALSVTAVSACSVTWYSPTSS
jgi:hypothetical protein